MNCRCEHDGLCAGEVKRYLGSDKHPDSGIPLCLYHGEVVTKLKTMKLYQLEKLAKAFTSKTEEVF